mmetsp:Transcript_37146/g.50282  ORF Transcript_37146/g.50282 Transcript_37146/m.50282 type:complete len:210 (-) Transcript_37146:121-750(-)
MLVPKCSKICLISSSLSLELDVPSLGRSTRTVEYASPRSSAIFMKLRAVECDAGRKNTVAFAAVRAQRRGEWRTGTLFPLSIRKSWRRGRYDVGEGSAHGKPSGVSFKSRAASAVAVVPSGFRSTRVGNSTTPYLVVSSFRFLRNPPQVTGSASTPNSLGIDAMIAARARGSLSEVIRTICKRSGPVLAASSWTKGVNFSQPLQVDAVK